MSTSVYKVTNTINGKVYFGKAADVWDRWYKHIWDAQHGSPLVFHRALRKYGPETFRPELLATYDSEAEANAHEIQLIASVPLTHRYNVAPGGNGGHTMSSQQIDAQYAIPSAKHHEFRKLFQQGWTTRRMAEHFQVAVNGVLRCARRLGLSFGQRRAAKPRPWDLSGLRPGHGQPAVR